MDRIIGLRLGRKRIEAAIMKAGPKGELAEYHSYDCAGEEEMVSSLRELAERLAKTTGGMQWIVGLPTAEFSFRQLSFPFKNKRAIASAVPFELEGLIPYPSESFVSSYIQLPTSDEQTKLLACAIQRERLDFYNEILGKAGITPRVITPDVEALYFLYGRISSADSDQKPPALLVSADEEVMHLCYVGETGWLDYHCSEPSESELERLTDSFAEKPQTVYIGGTKELRTAAESQDNSWKYALRASIGGTVVPDRAMIPLGLAMRGGSGKKHGFNFSEEAELFDKLRAGFKLTAAGLAILIILSFGFLFYRNNVKAEMLRQTKAEIGRVFKIALPSGRMVKPNFQLKQRLKELKASLKRAGIGDAGRLDLLWILKSLAERLPSVKGTILEEIIYDEQMVTIKGKAADFESVNRIRDLLSEIPAFKGVEVADSRSFGDTKKVSFKMRLEL